jgi:hypothetical protein
MTVPSPDPHDVHEPPPPTARVLTVGLIGVGLVVVAFVLGLATGAPRRGFDTHPWDGPRALLSAVGLLLAGCAVSMRPGWAGGWLCGAAAGLLGYGFGAPEPVGTGWYEVPPRNWYAAVPNSWDSVQLFFGVGGAVGLVGAVWNRLPRRAVYSLILVGVAFHFAGILSAITSPPPTPWLTDQYWKRVSRPYLQFAYMNNAYQFYSPDPGPATEMWVCLEYRPEGSANDPDAPKECAWVYVPRREQHYIDPLGLTYYRHLSITENIAQFQSSNPSSASEQLQVINRRARVANVPGTDGGIPRLSANDESERRVPVDLVSRHILPSFARHFAHAHARPGQEVTSVKIYRTLHVIIPLGQFRGFDPAYGRTVPPTSPYSPSLYLPYFQGDFTAKGELKDPQAPMLYWLVPIWSRTAEPPPLSKAEYRKRGGFPHYFRDYVSEHAGCPRPTED